MPQKKPTHNAMVSVAEQVTKQLTAKFPDYHFILLVSEKRGDWQVRATGPMLWEVAGEILKAALETLPNPGYDRN